MTENGDGTLTVTLSPNANTEAIVDILSSFGAVESIGVEQLRIEEIDEAAANQVANSRDANGESDSSTTALVAIFGALAGIVLLGAIVALVFVLSARNRRAQLNTPAAESFRADADFADLSY